MSFLRHEEIYQSDVMVLGMGWRGATLRPAPHRLDEFPAGYSLDGCSPAEPPSASPTGSSIREKHGAGNDFPANGNKCHYYLSQAWGAV